MSNIIWIVVIGFVAGIIALFLSRGDNNATGFILSTVLGIAGAFLATFVGQTVGWTSWSAASTGSMLRLSAGGGA
jgi:uncharacterized membrane protein YeaQ/YmgE (transglycosylase-associated protein family)